LQKDETIQSVDFSKAFAANLKPIVDDKTVIFAAGAGLRTFEVDLFKTWIALLKARMLVGQFAQNGGWPIGSRYL